MEPLRLQMTQYLNVYMTPESSSEFEKKLWDSFIKKFPDPTETLYIIQMKNYLIGLESGTFNPSELHTMDNIHSLDPQRWKEFNDLKQHTKEFEESAIATTDLFQCNRCKKRECIYTTAQTRSADESATLFIECIACGLRWKQ